MEGVKVVSKAKTFNGWATRYSHTSTALGGLETKFYTFVPSHNEGSCMPVLYYLAGLECTDETFIVKGGALKWAAKHRIILVCPDTSPRGAGVEGETESWDFGVGAGFYLDATTAKFSKNYRMYTYVTQELSELVHKILPTIPDKQGIFGHSMGGHGALTIALKNPDKFVSVSAFAPICNPITVPWGIKAFTGYLGEDQQKWQEYDASHLLADYKGSTFFNILVDQGEGDQFLVNQLKPTTLTEAASNNKNIKLNLRMHPEYNHSYFFVSTFMEEHLAHHARFLCLQGL
eukprot:Phypoly_transcript_13146.p1 GENE.Phypoly_transcript_13146~~Phypoly_transcript_13146.p1  ORF type:complete len:289 (-),score=35.10 Phypoly_transcript_13146:39-905(-)